METSPNTNRLITASVAILGGLLVTKSCEPEKTAPIKEKTYEIHSKTKTVIAPEPEPEVQPFTVDLRTLVRADGSWNPEFNFANAVGDCVEATGNFTCISTPGGDNCFYLPKDGPHLSVFIAKYPIGQIGSDQKGVSISLGHKDGTPYEADLTSISETQQVMDIACNDAITQGSAIQEEALTDIASFTSILMGAKGEEIENMSTTAFSELTANGFAPTEIGKNVFQMELDGKIFTFNPTTSPDPENFASLYERPNEDLNYEEYLSAVRVDFEVDGPRFYSFCQTIEAAMDSIEREILCDEL